MSFASKLPLALMRAPVRAMAGTSYRMLPACRMAVCRPAFTRSFSAASAVISRPKLQPKGKGHFILPPPKNVYGEAGLHALGLYESVKKASADAPSVLSELDKFRVFLKKDTSYLEDRLMDPRLKAAQKAELVKKTIGPLGVSPVTEAFLVKLGQEKNGYDKLKDVMEFYGELVRFDRAEILCSVTTAQALTSDQMSKLTNRLKQIVGTELTPVLTTQVDPKVLGGLLVTVGDKFQDLTVSSQISKLQKLVEAAA